MKKLKEILDDINQIHEVYKMDTINSGARPIYPSDMCRAIESYYGNGLTINIKEIPPTNAGNNGVIGVYRRIGKEVDIFHTATAEDGHPNYCGKRLIIAKELCQLITDDDDTFTSKPGDLLQTFTYSGRLTPPDITKQLEKERLVDEITKSLGMLLFFPIEEIFEVKDQQHLSGSNIDVGAIAEKYKLPKGYVEYILSDTIVSLLKDEVV